MVKIFSHGADPDGLGCVILAKLLFDELSITLCKNPADLDLELKKFLESQEYLSYDKIFVTDLCPSDEVLKKIESVSLQNFKVFDHHKTSREKLSSNYPFVFSFDELGGVITCATSIFYEYLKESSSISTPYLDTFVEYTRLHDTYEWKSENNLEAYQLQTLFQALGSYGYFYHFYLKAKQEQTFSYDEEEKKLIFKQNEKNREALEVLMEHLVVKKEETITYGSVIGSYEYRNLMADKVSEVYPDVDILLLLAFDNNSVSFRSLKDIPVEPLAKFYQGGGHERAASCSLTKENELKLIKRFFL